MNNKLSPSSKHKELKKNTILADKNRNQKSTHRINQIPPVQPLGNYKTTALTSFFPPPAVPSDSQTQSSSCTKPTIYQTEKNLHLIPYVHFLLYPLQTGSKQKKHSLTKVHNLVVLVYTSYLKLLPYHTN